MAALGGHFGIMPKVLGGGGGLTKPPLACICVAKLILKVHINSENMFVLSVRLGSGAPIDEHR